jgi:hypothetical protein
MKNITDDNLQSNKNNSDSESNNVKNTVSNC